MTLRAACNALILFAMSLTAACGGGGGGGGGGGSTPPPPSGGGGSTPAAITTGNATTVAAVGNGFLEAYTQLTISSLDNVFDLIESGGSSAAMTCSGGSGTITLTDNDGIGDVSAGDSVALNYMNCFQESLGDVVNGRIIVDIVNLSVADDLSVAGDVDIQIPANLTFNSVDGTFVDVVADYRVSFFATSTLENLTISTSGSQQMRIVIRDATTSLTETAQQVAVSRRFENDTYLITGSFDVDSETVGGEFDCDTTTDVTGDERNFPSTGTLACVGGGGSTVRVVADGFGGIVTEVDPEGDGTFVDAGVFLNGNGLWGDYVEGTLFFTQLDRPGSINSGLPPLLASESLGIDVVDAAYSAVNNRLYVTNDTGLAVVDPVTMTQVDFLAIADRPGAVAVSDDGSTLWIGLRDTPEVVPVDVASLTEGARVALGIDERFSSDRFATFLRVAPGTTDTIVVASAGTRDVVAFSAGAQLPNIVDESGAPTMFEFRDATSIVGIHDSTTAYSATLMSLDANGLVLLRNLQQYSRNFNAMLAVDEGIAWINYGRAIDVENELVLGRVDLGSGNARNAVYVDGANDRAWFYDRFGGTLYSYDTNSFLALGRYRVDASGNMVDMIGMANGEVLFVLETEIHRVNLTSAGPNYARSCTTIDLGGQLGTAVYLQIDCAFNDSVYDASRDVIYATLASAAGSNGNSVAVISPQTGTIQSYIPVGSEPDRLSISGGGTRLYVTLLESNRVAEVDLQTQQLVSIIRIEEDEFTSGPSFGVAIAASTQSETDVIVASEFGVRLYSNGTKLVDAPNFLRELVNVFYSADGSRAYGVDFVRTLWAFDVQATGLVADLQTPSVMQRIDVKIENDRLYDQVGAIVDPETATVVANCPVSMTTAVEPDPANDDVYYLLTGLDSEFQVCDESTETITRTFQIPRFGSSFFFPELTKAGSNRIAITNNDKMLLLDPTEF